MSDEGIITIALVGLITLAIGLWAGAAIERHALSAPIPIEASR